LLIEQEFIMAKAELQRSLSVWVIAVVALVFGLLTIKEGGTILFGDDAARAEAGNYVLFVVWINFVAGFFYIAAGVGLWLQQRWGVWLAAAIVAATATTFAAFGWHIYSGEGYEMRTVIAMSLRTVVWLVIAGVAIHALGRR
jgi:uncharacterized membrane protein (DUF2068 family)